MSLTAGGLVDQEPGGPDLGVGVGHLDELPVLVAGTVVVVANDGGAILRVA